MSPPGRRSLEDAYLRTIRGEAGGVVPALARAGLAIASGGYALAVRLRNARYDREGRAVRHAAVPVVSVGNLTLGGTGKTPMVEWVARWYRARGLRVAILSRGYGQDDGVNDEGRVLEENLPDVPHLQDADRAQIAAVAVQELATEILVLDDGFQHRRLARDLDLVLIDALEPFGRGWLFPRGLLREPVASLRRAGVVILSRADLVDEPSRAAIRAEAERRAGPLRWAEARHAPLAVIGSGGASEPIARLPENVVAAFCGIGNPEGFRRTLEPLCGRIAGFRVFPDHHPYTGADVADLTAWVREVGADLALTTQKDLVKLRALNLGSVPLRALKIGLEVMSGESLLNDALAAVLAR